MSSTRHDQSSPGLPHHVLACNDVSWDYPHDASLSARFAEQADRAPQAPAVAWDGGRWTYEELWRRVRRTAALLREHGVGDGDTVGVLLPRSPEWVVTALGVLTAGAVYLPLDPGHPESRLRAILDTAGVQHLVTSPDGPPRAAEDRTCLTSDDLAPPASADTSGTEPHASDESAAQDATATADNPRRSADDPAYVIFTSGSSGTPKGVVCAHRGPLRLALGTGDLRLKPEDRLLATTNPTFDVSCYELFAPLLNGACLVLPDPRTLLSTDALAALLRRERITVLWLSAGLFHQHAQEQPDMFSRVRCLIAGGDVLNPAAVQAVLAHDGPGVFLNGYGPTENSVLSTVHRVESLPPQADSVPIGRPVTASTAYVVRPDGGLAAVGEQGELWVGGDGVALGYLNDEVKTAEQFVPDPFGTEAGAGAETGDGAKAGAGRLYRTGDLASWREDGVLEFHGRQDRQVKIRGYRVELDEIESAMKAHPDVTDVAVDVVGEGAGQRLGAAVIISADAEPEGLVQRLREHTRDRLPAHMVPARVVVVDELPLTDSGKSDRARLMDLVERRRTGPDDETRAPRGEVEKKVDDVWRDTLDVDRIDRDDDFFTIGGTSLRATQVAGATRHELDIDPAHGADLIDSLLSNPTLQDFSQHADRLSRAAEPGDEDGAPPAAGEARTPVDFAAETAWPEGLRFDAPATGDPLRPRTVLLTGATGFLGVHLIAQLLDHGVQNVFCLARKARTPDEALDRITARMRRYGLDPAHYEKRLTALPGDLAAPHLGLDDADWQRLAKEADTIVHAGSHVNFAYPYGALAPQNVGGTRTVLRLAAAERTKPVHYISSIAVIVGFGTAGVRHVHEDTPLDHADRISLGYPETKWVAERLMRQAAERGLPVTIHRPYEITGTTDRGVWNTDTMMCALFRTIAETGTAPRMALPLDFVPVDHTAAVITHVITHEEPDGRVYHITNPRPALLDLAVRRLRAMGYPVRDLSYDDWVASIDRLAADNPEHPMAPYLPMFMEPAQDWGASVKQMYCEETFPAFDRTNVERALAGSGLRCPPVDDDLLDLNLGYLRESGFLPQPPTA
ncbi:amino acid adenylation domain-containing protein [Streptomyces sp. p1417]|uniref:Amino acid adenylation domain-containing protein n=1 Tax=Streptomyces typhae TaxID=2681492 RepID=A0A6L6X9S5_9ACTN|nr:amino acid adenylation domain-containing protein [Streptomyces typhae]MVO90566.1 amino acid adenylation domain-containing protein [Streptomyces typhae]